MTEIRNDATDPALQPVNNAANAVSSSPEVATRVEGGATPSNPEEITAEDAEATGVKPSSRRRRRGTSLPRSKSSKQFKGFDKARAELFKADEPANGGVPGATEHDYGVLPSVEILGPRIELGFSRAPDGKENKVFVGDQAWEWNESGIVKGGAKADRIPIPKGVDLHNTLWLKSFLPNTEEREGIPKGDDEVQAVIQPYGYKIEDVRDFMDTVGLEHIVLSLDGNTHMPDPDRFSQIEVSPVGSLGHRYQCEGTMIKGILLYINLDHYHIEFPGPAQAGKTFDGVNWARYDLASVKQRLLGGAIIDPSHWVTTHLPHKYVTAEDKPELGTEFWNTYEPGLNEAIRPGRLDFQEKAFYKDIFGLHMKEKASKEAAEFMWLRVENAYLCAKLCCLSGILFREYFYWSSDLREMDPQSHTVLRTLISVFFPWSLNKMAIFSSIYRDGMYGWGEAQKKRFLRQTPVLEKWLPVLNKSRDPAIWDFVLLFLETQGIMVDPDFWSGHNLDFVLVLYWVQCTGHHLLYVEAEEAYYRYNKQWWEQISETALIGEVKAFYSSQTALSGVASKMSPDAKNLLEEQVRDHVTIERWPGVPGYNVKNGFVTLYNGLYVLRDHHPGNFQRDLFQVHWEPTTSQPISPLIMRFQMDLSGNRVMSGTLNKLADFISLSPGQHNIILNYTGNPRGSKTQKLNFLSEIVGKGVGKGELTFNNSFRVKDYFLNKTLVTFPDADLTKLNGKAKDILKRVSGRDAITGEIKFGKSFSITPRCTCVLSSNTSLEEFRDATDKGMADRLLTLRLPQIVEGDARVTGLSDYHLGQSLWMNNFFWSTLSCDHRLLNQTDRANLVNEVTGSVKRGLFERFMSENLIKLDKSFLYLGDLVNHFNQWAQAQAIKGFITKADLNKAVSKQSHQEDCNNFLGSWNPVPVYKRRERGMGWQDLALTKVDSDGDSPQTPTPVELSMAAQAVQGMMNKNPFKQSFLTFHESDGQAIRGPGLSPFVNLYTMLSFLKVRNTNIRSLLFGEIKGGQNNTHLESTGFGGRARLSQMGFSDFFEMSSLEYQPFFAMKNNQDLDQDNVTGQFIYHKTSLSDLFTGVVQGMLITGKPRFGDFSAKFLESAKRVQYGAAGDWLSKVYQDWSLIPGLRNFLGRALQPTEETKPPLHNYGLLPWRGVHYLVDLQQKFAGDDAFKRHADMLFALQNQTVDELTKSYSLEQLTYGLVWFEHYYLKTLENDEQKNLFRKHRSMTRQLLQTFDKSLSSPNIAQAYTFTEEPEDDEEPTIDGALVTASATDHNAYLY